MEANNITDKIIEAANNQANKIISDAKAIAKKQQDEAEQDIEAQRKANLSKAAGAALEIKNRHQLLSKLDSKKTVLAAKQALVDEVYLGALKSVRDQKDAGYKDFIFKLITKNAKKGDALIISKNDSKLFDDEFMQKIWDKCGFKLKLLAEHHDDEGGVILRGEVFDKKLTLSSIMQGVREQTEQEVIARLYNN